MAPTRKSASAKTSASKSQTARARSSAKTTATAPPASKKTPKPTVARQSNNKKPEDNEKALNLSAKSLWPKATELVSLEFTLRPLSNCTLYPQYTIGLHAWFLQQIRDLDAELSAYLHDGESEKLFSLTGLNGQFTAHSQSLQLQAENTYYWRINGLSQRATQGMALWLKQLPQVLDLKDAPLTIESVRLAAPATTYAKLLRQGKSQAEENNNSISLSFNSPTSFRRKGHHMPLPWPTNVFHSYLRRWNHFAKKPVEQTTFLGWIDTHVILSQHQLASVKVAAGKQGSVTGFTGAVVYTLDRQATEQLDFCALFYALAQLAPYCGTGHKTTFGLGETRLGWRSSQPENRPPSAQQLLANRIEDLTELFLSQKKRQGGHRATETAQKWATILARRENGDGLKAIAQDMDLPYETAKTYSKLARRALKNN